MPADDELKTFAMTVTSKGQVTLPVEFRSLAGIGVGDKLDLIMKPSGESSIKVRRGRLADLRGMVKWDKGPISDDALEDMIAAARGRRAKP